MLVIISDLHLTDGTSGETIDEKAFRIFRNRVSDMAYDASWRMADDKADKAGGQYKPIERIDILFLGDIVDMIRSEQWNTRGEEDMPWTEQRSEAFFDNICKIAEGVLAFNKKSFAILKGIANGGIKIPASMTVLTSDKDKIEQKIGSVASEEKFAPEVRIYYMVGNHDWFLYINDPRMDTIRNRIIDELGLANERDKPFPFYPSENPALLQTQIDHHVYALHGDIFDKTNYRSPDRDRSSIGDVVVLKLLNEVPKTIEQEIRKPERIGTVQDIDEFIKELHEIDNLRPYTLAPKWISEVIRKHGLDERLINDCIRGALRKLIQDYTKNPLVSPHLGTVVLFKIAELMLKGHLTMEDLSTVIHWSGQDKNDFESYRQHALELADREDGRNKMFYIMGHTHDPEIVPMSSFTTGGKQYSQIYMNTGTWRTLHKEGIRDKTMISYKTMTIAGFFKGDERMGHNFEFWTGSLDL